jgi:small subunit ribosomal protein S17
MTERKPMKTRVGEVTSTKMDKTVTVKVERRVTHPVYGRIVTRSVKLHAHDPENSCQVGDVVRVAETRPLSKMKRYRLVEIVKRGGEKYTLPTVGETA